MLNEIYRYREMLISLVHRDLRGRYKNSVLGFLWTFINPLLQLAVYTIVFSTFMRMGLEKYSLFLFVALIPWMFFSTSVMGGANCILDNKNLVTKIYFPREILPLSVVTSNFINMVYCFIVVLIVTFFYSDNINLAAWLILPLVAVIEFIVTLGIVLAFSALTVYYRDLQHILGIGMMAWQFLTPVMYPVNVIPEEYLPLFTLNPMMPIIIAYRDILYYGRFPDTNGLIQAFVTGIICFVVGWGVFTHLKKRFAEEL